MTTGVSRWGALALSAMVGCVAPGPSERGAGRSLVEDAFDPYPGARPLCDDLGARACFRRLGSLTPKNIDLSSGAARDQGTIASCASHGFIGMLENQLHAERGITVDLSERYQLYSNFMHTGNLGTDPAVIARFPEIVAQYGLMPETTYPYAAVLANADRFHQDLAQGLSEAQGPTVEDAIGETAGDSAERHAVLTGEAYLGALPEPGARPVHLPVSAQLDAGAQVPEIEYVDEAGNARLVACFGEPTNELAVTPREFLALCFDHAPERFFACAAGDASLSEQGPEEATCTFLERLADERARVIEQKNLPVLQNLMTLLDLGQASLVAALTPDDMAAKTGPVWTASGNIPSGGHAVTAVGYLTPQELADPTQQDLGMLRTPASGSSIFDALAVALEPAHADRIARALELTDPADRERKLAEARTASSLGQAAQAEGGLLLFRNSWGQVFGDQPIGVGGYQTMTFEFFLQAEALVTSRSVPPLDASSCVVPDGFGRADAFFQDFSTEAHDLGFRAVAGQLVAQLRASDASPEMLEAASAEIAACR